MTNNWKLLNAASNDYDYFKSLYFERRKTAHLPLFQETRKQPDRNGNTIRLYVQNDNDALLCKPGVAARITAAFERAEKEYNEEAL